MTLADLAKFGALSISPQGSVMVNNQPLQSMNMASLTQALSNNMAMSANSSPDQGLLHAILVTMHPSIAYLLFSLPLLSFFLLYIGWWCLPSVSFLLRVD